MMRTLRIDKLLAVTVFSALLLACNSENQSTSSADSAGTACSNSNDSPPISNQSTSSVDLMRALEHDKSEVIVHVNGKSITRDDLDRHLRRKATTPAGSGSEPKPADSESGPKEKEEALQDLIKVELIYQAAFREGYDSRQDIFAEAARRTKELIAEVYLLDIVANAKFTDEALRAEYEREIEEASNQYKVHLISRSTEEKAREVIRTLNDGAAHFMTLAKEKSEDPAAAQDGDLGWYTLGKLYPSLAEAVQTLEVGDYSRKPIRGRSVWHVLFLEDKRELVPKAPEFEKVKEQARLRLTSQLYQSTVDRLKAEAIIEPVSAP